MMKRIAALLLTFALLLAVLSASAASFDEHKATAYMNIRFQCGCSRVGTGAMVGRRGLVTCAHNLICPTHSQWYKSITFVFGAKSASSGQKKVSSGFNVTAYETFKNGYKSDHDIGFVVFDKPIGDSTGWYAFQVGSDEFLHEEFTHINYYNANGKFQDIFTIQYVADGNQLKLDDHPYSGGDGAPVFLAYEGLDWPTVVAVYTSYDNNGKGYARRLTSQVYEDMRNNGAFD